MGYNTGLEKDIQTSILNWLQYQPFTFVWRQNSGMRISEYKGKKHVFRASSAKGISDIVGIWKRHPIAIEVKRPGEHPTEEQLAFMDKFAQAGGISIAASSLEQIVSALKELEEAWNRPKGGMLDMTRRKALHDGRPAQPLQNGLGRAIQAALQKGDCQ